jgi:predicted RNA-binding Zn-ribbon protein involved in translation (DUF1610 family)
MNIRKFMKELKKEVDNTKSESKCDSCGTLIVFTTKEAVEGFECPHCGTKYSDADTRDLTKGITTIENSLQDLEKKCKDF